MTHPRALGIIPPFLRGLPSKNFVATVAIYFAIDTISGNSARRVKQREGRAVKSMESGVII